MTVESWPRVLEYINGEFGRIQGWCNPYIFQAIEPIVEYQHTLGVQAPIAEIGVYHGKFFIGLIKAVSPITGHYAFDVFDLQDFNLDYAGNGNYETFRQNILNSGEDVSSITIVRGDSTSLRNDDIANIRRNVGGFSFFSIDGCHMAEHTINDISIAMELTLDSGIIFVDDYYNPDWPGVQEGVSKLFLTSSPRFIPLLYTSNKLFMCHIGYHQRYLAFIEKYITSHFPKTRIKKNKRFGYETLTLNPTANG